MGAQCQYCPAEANFQDNTAALIGFEDTIQALINDLRQQHQASMGSCKDHRIGNAIIFRGTYEDGKRNGYGEYYNDRNAFFGTFQDDLPHGEGLLVQNFSEFIKGNFVQGKLHGQGREKTKDATFNGTYENGERSSGILTTDKFTYEGDFSGNKFNGYGTIEYTSGDIYEGYFKNGLYDGDGKYETEAGVYNGEFKEGKYEGRGIFRWKDGSYYDGEYRGGQRNGLGRLVMGEFTHEGFWVDGAPSKKGEESESGIRGRNKKDSK